MILNKKFPDYLVDTLNNASLSNFDKVIKINSFLMLNAEYRLTDQEYAAIVSAVFKNEPILNIPVKERFKAIYRKKLKADNQNNNKSFAEGMKTAIKLVGEENPNYLSWLEV